MPIDRFSWITFDVRSLLPLGWQEQIILVAQRYSRRKALVARHSTSREGQKNYWLPTQTVDGEIVAKSLPWLRLMYEREFLGLAQQTTSETVSVMSDRRFGIVLSIQSGDDRYECHVDTNPIEGLLYVTTHREGDGGELMVSNRGEAQSVEDVNADASLVEPKAGYLVFLNGRHHSHYVAKLKNPDSMRIVVAMNYYVPSWSEAMRPIDLNRHLWGHDIESEDTPS